MGSYENIVKIEEMRRRMNECYVLSALKILETIEMKKIKNMTDLSLMAEVYDENEQYDEAIELYLKIYEKTKSRKSLYQLTELSIKRNNIEDAKYYLAQYQIVAPKDFYNYVFRYKIDKIKRESYEQLIETLKALKNTEYMEQWAYELAKTYYKAGMEKECIRECSDIILWFGEGIYVEKAKMLRSYYSGESGKEKIMEELKRRAMEQSNQGLQEVQLGGAEEEVSDEFDDAEDTYASEDTYTSEDTYASEEIYASEDTYDIEDTYVSEDTYSSEDPYSSEEDICSNSNFMDEEETVAFEVELKKDVQDILKEGWEEEPQYEEDDNSYNEVYIEETEANELPKILQEATFEAKDFDFVKEAKERAEQEVEDAIYQLLQEENMDEEDKKLIQIAEELEIDLEEIFDNFLHVKSVKKQLVKSLESMLDEHTKTVQMIITGTVGSGKTALAKDITIFLNKAGKLKSSKIAKIKAEKLNTIDVMAKKETLRDCCLVIENASELKRETIDSLLELSQVLQGDIAVIFEENKINMNKLFRESPKLMDLFKNRIHLPQYTQEDLMGFAYACLKQQEYTLNPKAESLLLNKINNIAKQSEPHMHLEQIYDLMQSAINAADIRTGRQLSALALQGKLKDVENLSVLPEDFTIKL